MFKIYLNKLKNRKKEAADTYSFSLNEGIHELYMNEGENLRIKLILAISNSSIYLCLSFFCFFLFPLFSSDVYFKVPHVQNEIIGKMKFRPFFPSSAFVQCSSFSDEINGLSIPALTESNYFAYLFHWNDRIILEGIFEPHEEDLTNNYEIIDRNIQNAERYLSDLC